MLNKSFPSPSAEQVLSSHRYIVLLYMGSYATSIATINKSEYGP